MHSQFLEHLSHELEKLKDSGLYKNERIITSPQAAIIQTQENGEVINLCANNYLGLANRSEIIQTAHHALDEFGYGLSSVRFICGTQSIHKQLEDKLSRFLMSEDTLLYSSCFDANTGLFETLLGEEDAIFSDELNHASIIDGIRLCKAARFRYRNNDMKDLEQQLSAAPQHRFRVIVTDGVFSMDGSFANLPAIAELAEKYQALLMVDDSHAVGFIGEEGRGTPEYWGLRDRVDILTGTLGKALGGASGGYTSGSKMIIDWLRQRSRPYLFSNTLAPVIASTSITVLNFIQTHPELRIKLSDNARYFRTELSALGFKLLPGEHPIIPVMVGDAKLAANFADALLAEGIYVISFTYPVVPMNQARIRTQMSASHTEQQLNTALKAFAKVGKKLGIIG